MFYPEQGRKGKNSMDETQVKVKVCDCGIRHLVIQNTFSLWGDAGSSPGVNGRL